MYESSLCDSIDRARTNEQRTSTKQGLQVCTQIHTEMYTSGRRHSAPLRLKKS